MKLSLKSLLALVTICAVVLAVGSCVYRNVRRQTIQLHVTSQVANRYLMPLLHLPDEAADVTIYVDFGAEEAEFAISEEAFLTWCNDRGWQMAPLTEPTVYFEPMCLPADNRIVRQGYTFWPAHGQGVFDAERCRACFWTSTFP